MIGKDNTILNREMTNCCMPNGAMFVHTSLYRHSYSPCPGEDGV